MGSATALEFIALQLYSLAAAWCFREPTVLLRESPGWTCGAVDGDLRVATDRPTARGHLLLAARRTAIGSATQSALYNPSHLWAPATNPDRCTLPTYARWAGLRPILLLALRLLQGFGAGAARDQRWQEYVAEYAPAQKRVHASLVGLAPMRHPVRIGAWAILLAVRVESDVIAWGWRILPFIAIRRGHAVAILVRAEPQVKSVFEEREDAVDWRALSRDKIVEQGPSTALTSAHWSDASASRPSRPGGFSSAFGQAATSSSSDPT